MAWHARSRELVVDGRRTHVVDAGEGPPVLLLHGFLHSSWTWRATIEALTRGGRRVIAPCLPGFGWSEVAHGDVSLAALLRWTRALLDALGVERLSCAIGNSLGGGLCLALAHDAPARVERLALVSPLGSWLPVPSLPLRLLGASRLDPLYRATAGQPAFVRRLLQLTAYRARIDEEVMRGFAHLSRPGSHAAAIAHARQLRAASVALARLLPQVHAPTLLVWGTHDRLLPLRWGRAIASRLPAARLEPIPGAGHCAHEEQPERFQALLSAFLPAVRAAGNAGGPASEAPPALRAAR